MLDTKKDDKIKKVKSTGPPTKIVIRHLPPKLTQAEFLDVVCPLPDHNYFKFCAAEKSILGHCHSRAYINFKNPADIYTFRDQFDGYVFVDQEGNEGTALVEYAPFQKVFQKDASKQTDKKCGTIEEDEEFMKFINSLKNPEPASVKGTDKMLEDINKSDILLKAQESSKTPLMEYLEERRSERKRPGEYISERMQRKESRRQQKLERQAKRDEARKLRDEKRRGIIRKEDKEPQEDLPEYMKRAHAKYNKRIEEHFYDKRERRSLRRALERDEKRKEMERLSREEKGDRIKKSRPIVEVKKPYKDDKEEEAPVEEKVKSKRYSVLKRSNLKKQEESKTDDSLSQNRQTIDRQTIVKTEDSLDFSQDFSDITNNTTKEFDFENERLVFVNKKMLNREAAEFKGIKYKLEDVLSENDEMELDDYETETQDFSRSKSEKIPENNSIDDENFDSTKNQNSNLNSVDLEDSSSNVSNRLKEDELGSGERKENPEDTNEERVSVSKENTKSEEKESEVKTKERTEETKYSRNDPRLERKIRNKDRPSLQIYRPGQSRLSRLNSKQDDDKMNQSKSTSGENDSSSTRTTPSPTFGEPHEKNSVKMTVGDAEVSSKTKPEQKEKITSSRSYGHKDQTKRPTHATRFDHKKSEYTATKDETRSDIRKNDHGPTRESTTRTSGYGRNSSNVERRNNGGRTGGRSFTNRKYVSSHQVEFDTPNSSQSQEDIEPQPPSTNKPQGKRYSKIRTKVSEKNKEQPDD